MNGLAPPSSHLVERALVGLVAAAMLTWSTDVRAQASAATGTGWGPVVGGQGIGPVGRAWGEVGFMHRDGASVLSPLVGGAVFMTESIELDAVFPAAFLIGDENAAVIGNINLGVAHFASTDRGRQRVGLAVGLPTARADNFEEGFTLDTAALMRVEQELWFWPVDAIPITVPLHTELKWRFMILMSDIAVSAWVPIGDRADPEVIFQITPTYGFELGATGIIGWRIPIILATLPTGGQIGLEPFLRFGHRVFFIARGTLTFDHDPNSDEILYGAHTGMGATF